MTNTYKETDSMETKTLEEMRCIRCVLERLLNHFDSSAFVDYQMEKFGKDYRCGEKVSEHIKTGNEIYLDICGICCDVDDIRSDKWVSLSWLKEQIGLLRQFKEVKPEYYDAIKDVLNLLSKE
jgi:hypothetical protein